MKFSSSFKGKGVVYDFRIDNLLPSREYNNKEEKNNNNCSNQEKYVYKSS